MYQYSNIAPSLKGQNCIFFILFFCLAIPKRDLDTKRTPLNIENCPESLGAMLKYLYIERGPLSKMETASKCFLIKTFC